MWSAIKQYFTKTNSISFAHKWTIENYSRLYAVGHPWKWKICSDRFTQPNNEQFIFELYLYPKGESESWKDYVMLGVSVHDMPQIYEGKINCRWHVLIEDKNGQLWGAIQGSKDNCLFKNRAIITPKFMEYSKLLNGSYLFNDRLTLYFFIHLQADERIFNMLTNTEVSASRFNCANKVTKAVHTWTVENFADLFDKYAVAPYFIQSEYFPALDEKSERFSLKLSPNRYDEEGNNNNVDIAIIRNDNGNSATVHWRMSILDVDGEEWGTQEWTEKIDSDYGRHFDYNRAHLLDNSNGLIVDKKLRIHYEMSYMMDDKPKTATNNAKMLDSVHKSESLYNVANKAIHFVSHQWTIDKFSALCLNSPQNHSIDSPIFEPFSDPGFKFSLRLWPNSHDEHSKSNQYLDLVNVSLDTKQVTVQYRITFLDANEQQITRWSDQLSVTKYDKTRISIFFHRTQLQDPSFMQQFLSNDKLTIFCELWVVQDRKIYKPKPTNIQSLVNNPSTSSSAVLNMTNANLQGAIINVQGGFSMNDFNVNTLSNDGKIKK